MCAQELDPVSFRPVPEAERTSLWEMLQVYLRELSAYDARLRPRRGRIPYVFFDFYWSDPEHRFPFFIYWEEKRAGLLLVSEGERPGYGYADRCVELSEIYVAPPYRKRGIGHRAMEFTLRMACDRGRPLLWSCYADNTLALRLYYSFAAARQQCAQWCVRITDMVDSHGCNRKNFRIETAE